jgi:DNA-binding HxlR family transcriptional regulator
MRWRDIGGMTCSIARALSIVGDRWTLLILRDAFLRTRRFEDFQAHLGLTRHRLADRLRKLVANGILERVRYQERPSRFEYRLTEKGRDLYPVIAALVGWGDRWLAGDDGAPVELVHRTCGRQMTPVLVCPSCREPVRAGDMQARPGPALRRLAERAGSPAIADLATASLHKGRSLTVKIAKGGPKDAKLGDRST